MVEEIVKNLTISYKGRNHHIVNSPAYCTLDQLISWLKQQLNLPASDECGNTIQYSMKLRRSIIAVPGNNTLVAINIQERDVIELESEISSGANQIPSHTSPASARNDDPPIESGGKAMTQDRIVPGESDVLPTDDKPSQLEEKEPWKIVDDLGHEVVGALKESAERKDQYANALLGIDRNILLVFSIALLGSLFFTFYLIVVDKLSSVTTVTLPIISLILGFLSGYFAGTGRTKGGGQG